MDTIDNEKLEDLLDKLIEESKGYGYARPNNVKAQILARAHQEQNEAVLAAIVHIMSAKTEGLFDDGDLFIKRAPVEQAVVDLIGYEKFKAIMDSLPAVNLEHQEGKSNE